MQFGGKWGNRIWFPHAPTFFPPPPPPQLLLWVLESGAVPPTSRGLCLDLLTLHATDHGPPDLADREALEGVLVRELGKVAP